MLSDSHGQDSLSQPSVFSSPGYDKLYPKEGTEEGLAAIKNQDGKDGRVEGMGMATAKEQETFYSPLGEPDLRDLPLFAYQISQGMVCAAMSNDTQLQSSMFLIHYTVLPTPSGVPFLHGGPPPGPGLPQHPGG